MEGKQMARDMTEKQYKAALAKYGFESIGFMGYYKLPKPFSNTHVSALNGGVKRRGRLAYLLQELSKAENSAAKVKS